MRTWLLPLLSHINLWLLLHQPMLITSISHWLRYNQTWGCISHSFHINPHTTYNIQLMIIWILYILCQYITIIPLLYHNLLLLGYLPLVSTLILKPSSLLCLGSLPRSCQSCQRMRTVSVINVFQWLIKMIGLWIQWLGVLLQICKKVSPKHFADHYYK